MVGIYLAEAFPKLTVIAQIALEKFHKSFAYFMKTPPGAEIYFGFDLFFDTWAFTGTIGFDKLTRRPFTRLWSFRRKQ